MKNDNKLNRKNILSNFIWRYLERCGAQSVTFVVTIVLARILTPEIYGTVALMSVFTVIMQVFIESGLGNALIQKKDSDDIDFSTVFYFNIFICVILYFLLFLLAPVISDYYEMDNLAAPIRVLGLAIIISGVKNIQQAYVSKTLQFKRFFFATLGGTIGAGFIGIFMALQGFGVWALICQYLFNNLVDTIILWATVKWRPRRIFSFKRLKKLVSYGWKIFASGMISTLYVKARQLIIGKYYSPGDLGYYSKGNQFPEVIVTNINHSIDSVLFPVMSKSQNDLVRLKAIARRAITTSCFIMWPIMFGLMAIAEPLVKIVLTDKWLPCVFYLRVFCLIYSFEPFQTANLNALKAIGRSDVYLKIETVKKIIGFAGLIFSCFISVKAIALAYLLTAFIGMILNAYPSKKLISYSFREQVKDVLPSLLLAIIMFLVCVVISFLNINNIIIVILQIVVGAFIYISLAYLFKLESFVYCLSLVKSYIPSRKCVSKE